MKYVRYILILEEPVKMGTQGNQANSSALSYIAGSSIRGAVISALSKDIAEDELKQHIKSVRFYDAYIMNEDKYMIPVPFIYYAGKHEIRSNERELSAGNDTGLKINSGIADVPEEGEQRIDVGGFCYVGDRLYSRKVKKLDNIHIAISKGSASNKMFRYEAIDAGQDFSGVVACPDEYANRYVEALKDRILYLGGSKGSGYGRCRVAGVDILSYNEMIAEYGIKRQTDSDILCIYALSNLILYDDNGCVSGELPVELLKNKLGLQKMELIKAYVQTTTASGFNHTWRAGSVLQNAVKAGSVYVYKIQGKPDEKQIEAVEMEQLGVRKQDGYGRIVINPDFYVEERVVVKSDDTRKPVTDLSEDDKSVLMLIQNSANKERVDNYIRDLALKTAENNRNIIKKLSITQISRLYGFTSELIIHNPSDKEIKERMKKYHDDIFFRTNMRGEIDDKTSATKNKYSTAKFKLPNNNSEKMKDVLEDIFDNDNTNWGIKIDNDDVHLLKLTGIEENRNYISGTMIKLRFLNEVMYNLMRMEGGKGIR